MTIERNDEHVAQALGHLVSQFREATQLRELVSIYMRQVQEIENLLVSLCEQIDIDAATGPALNALGAVVDEQRNNRSDANYRLAIKAKILLIRSQATHEDVLGLVEALVPSLPLQLFSYFPAAFEVLVDGAVDPTTIDVNLIARFIREGSAAGVGANVILGASPVFKFDTAGQGFDEGTYAEIF